MRILHTADWHLGQKFLNHDRQQEHQLALDWLFLTIQKEQIELLVVAGDIFDIGNPPNYARKQYYHFLRKLLRTTCRHVVIVGGNHDAPTTLNAPKDILEALNVHVVGCVTEDPKDQIIPLLNDQGEVEAVVAAVPFLRDRDLRKGMAGGTTEDRLEQIRNGIEVHYQLMAELIEPYKKDDIPLIATGHLHAKETDAPDEQKQIYIGDRENISAKQFPKIFSYIALGHLHRAQMVGQEYHIRYSGSLIPLRFNEIGHTKSVTIAEFAGSRLAGGVRELEVPTFRKLIHMEGKPEEIKEQLEQLVESSDKTALSTWVEASIELEQMAPNLAEELRQQVKGSSVELLTVRLQRRLRKVESKEIIPDLQDWSDEQVFQRRCETLSSTEEELEELLDTYRELKNWMAERERE